MACKGMNHDTMILQPELAKHLAFCALEIEVMALVCDHIPSALADPFSKIRTQFEKAGGKRVRTVNYIYATRIVEKYRVRLGLDSISAQKFTCKNS